MYDFGLTPRQFWKSTPAQFIALAKLKRLREKQEDGRAVVMPVMFNNAFGGTAEPGDIFPSLKQKKRAMTGAEMIGTVLGYFPRAD